MDTEPTEVNLGDDYECEQSTHYTSVEKIVKKVFIDEKPLAAKIYKSEVEGVTIDREQKARAEFAAYSLLSQTALSEFTPEAQALIMDDHGRIIGLTVNWREGRSLSDLAPEKVLSIEQISQLKHAFLSLIKEQTLDKLPSSDMWSEGNIHYNPSDHQLWLGECHLAKYTEINNYLANVNKGMEYLLKNHVSQHN